LGRVPLVIRGQPHFFNLPSLNIKFQADIVFQTAFDEAVKDGMMSEDEKIITLYRRELWNDDLEFELKKLKDSIDNLKLRLYMDRIRPNRLAALREELAETRERIIQLDTKRAVLDSLTCHGYATSAKLEFFMTKIVKPFSEDLIDDYVTNYHKTFTPERQLRFVARNEPWRTMYVSLKTRALKVKPYNWGVDQRGLILWSKMYDNIFNCEDKPENWVIEDDDLLDGWMIWFNRERKLDKKEKGKRSLTNKGGYNESFIFIDEEDDGRGIEELNSPLENAIKRRKLDEIPKDRAVNVTTMAVAQEQMRGANG
jgi:hypothetical protein